MGFWDWLFNRNKKALIKEAETFFLNYLQGNITTEEFLTEYRNNENYQKVLKEDKTRWKKEIKIDGILYLRFGKGPFDFHRPITPDNLLEKFTPNDYINYLDLYYCIDAYFWNRNIKVKMGNKEAKYCMDLINIMPKWLNDFEYIKKIYESIPGNLKKSERKALAKAKIKELFCYDKTPPKWLQSPEWPIDKDGPLVFSHQVEKKNELYVCEYYFYDKTAKEQTVIVQFDYM